MPAELLHHSGDGVGPPVALLHPVGLNLTFWRPLVVELSGRFRLKLVG